MKTLIGIAAMSFVLAGCQHALETSEREATRTAINIYFDALNAKDMAPVPFSDDAVLSGPIVEPDIVGADNVKHDGNPQ